MTTESDNPNHPEQPTQAQQVYRGILRMPDGSKGTYDISNVPDTLAAQKVLQTESGARVAMILVPNEKHIQPVAPVTSPNGPDVA